MALVSVIIPTYNHAEFVLRTLESVFAQAFSDYEVIVVNDGSPDNTAEVLAPLVQAGRIIYIEQPNAGQAAARNRGLAIAKGDYIAFLDDDDLWPASKLQWQTGMLERNIELIAVGGGVELVDSTGKSIGTVPAKFEEITWARLFSGSPFWSPGQTLIRTQSLRRIGGLNQRIWGADDFDLWFRLAAIGRVVAYADLSLYYRIHEGNASKNALRMFRNTLGVLEKYLSEQPPELREPSSRNAFRFLYAYAGKQLLRGVRSDLRKRRFLAVLSGLKEFSALLLPAVVDPSLSRQIGRDFFLALSKRRKAFGAK